MLLSIVTLNYKTPDLTIECISSVFDQFKNELKAGVIEHIIVDNNSADDSVKKIKNYIVKNKIPGVILIENKENVGFGNGCNLGTQKAKGKYVLFLNSDTKVEDRGFIEMTEFLNENPKVAIMGGKMKNFDGTPQLSAWKFYTLPNLILMLLGFERFGMLHASPTSISRVDWVTGGCMMVNKELFEKIGSFDKQIFMYMEDMELCFRAKKHGFETYYFPNIHVLHKSQGSSNRSFAIINIYKGIHYFYQKHMPIWEQIISDILLKTKGIILVIIGRILGNNYLVTTYEQTLKLF
ncbi:MAG TPA: glycosyltransferase family 2 protein [Patescibacteria group bacterium]